VYRNFKNDKISIGGLLDDYALLMDAFITLFQTTGNIIYFDKAKDLLNYTLIHFYDKNSGLFFYSSDDENTPVARKMEITDNVIASSNAVTANSLFLLGKIEANLEWIEMSEQMLSNVWGQIASNIRFFGRWASLGLQYSFGHKELAILGAEAQIKVLELLSTHKPNILVALSDKESDVALLKNRFEKNKTLYYLCFGETCQLPVEHFNELNFL
jgi:uncharacterized protein YyaL (SSP411 family)